MKGKYLPCFLLVLLFSACQKEPATRYQQVYSVAYFPGSDSFKAIAAFLPPAQYEAVLTENESVTFNGKTYDLIEPPYNHYLWRGKGKPQECKFVFTRGRKHYENSISGASFAKYELIVPANISRSGGAVIRLKGVSSATGAPQSITFRSDQKVFSLGISGDSVVLLPEHLKGITDANLKVSFEERDGKPISEGDGEHGGR